MTHVEEGSVSRWERLLDQPPPGGHVVQLYDADISRLARNVGRYLADGLNQQGSAIVIACKENSDAFVSELKHLGVDPERCQGEGRLLLLDASRTMATFMVDGQPDWVLFENSVGSIVRELCERSTGGLRAYGDIVGLLWTAGQFSAAMALEKLWNKLLQSAEFSLFCAYPIDVFGKTFHSCDIEALLCSHTHFLPAEGNGDLESAIYRAMDEVLGPSSERLQLQMRSDLKPSWAVTLKAEVLILWLRENLGQYADAILAQARQHYTARPV